MDFCWRKEETQISREVQCRQLKGFHHKGKIGMLGYSCQAGAFPPTALEGKRCLKTGYSEMHLQPSTDPNRGFSNSPSSLYSAGACRAKTLRIGREPAQTLRLNSKQMPGVPKNFLVRGTAGKQFSRWRDSFIFFAWDDRIL